MYICVCFIGNQYNTSSSTQGLLTLSNIQHGVRIEAVSLQQGEHMVESMQFPAYIQSSRQVQ